MGKIIETRIDRFNGGVVNDPRDPREATARMVSNFDALTNPQRLTPYRDSESGDSSASTSQKQNFLIALRTGTTYRLYALGVVSGTARAEVLMKDLTTGSSDDLDDATWATPNNNQSSAGSTNFELFVYYRKTGLIYGARAGTHIWAFDPSSVAVWADSSQALTYTNIAQGLVHSKDDILYVPYDNKIAKNDNGSWTTAALTLPTHFKINSICEYGNYLAIACAPLSGVGKSVVYLWDRDSSLTTLSETIDWGEGDIKVLEELEGALIGISLSGNSTTRFNNRLVFKYWTAGTIAKKFQELISSTTGQTSLLIGKLKLDNRLYFMARMYLNGAQRDGVWSVGLGSDGRYSIVHERTPNNDTAIGAGGVIYNFFFVGDYLFQSYNSSNTFALSKTNDSASYTHTSIYESKRYNGSQIDPAVDSSHKKSLVGISVTSEYLPSAGQIVAKYRKDEETSFTTILTNVTDNSISQSAVNIESSGAALPKEYKEIEFRLESTGGGEITAFSFKEEVIGKRSYE